MKPTVIDFSEQKVSKVERYFERKIERLPERKIERLPERKTEIIEDETESDEPKKCRYGSDCSILISDGLEFYEI